MIIYLDLNKWIQLAQIVNGKDMSERSRNILNEFESALQSGCITPLSSMHYIEFARISNVGRRKRLGKVMWEYSNGYTLAPYSQIIEWEIEKALKTYFPEIIPHKFELIGKGIEFTFGTKIVTLPTQDELNKRILCGDNTSEPILSKHLDSIPLAFLNHLEEFKKKKVELPASKHEDWLYGVTMADIINPINRVLNRYNIDPSLLFKLSIEEHRNIINSMPTRMLDIHFHRQILKNPNFKTSRTDLGDMGGIGIASCYCDVVVCEKHFADLLKRDGYRPFARIETDIGDFIRNI